MMRKCQHCHGKGYLNNDPNQKCGVCGGKGYITVSRYKHNQPSTVKEQAPTNSMGMSSYQSGPVQGFDPLLGTKLLKRKSIQNFSTFREKSRSLGDISKKPNQKPV